MSDHCTSSSETDDGFVTERCALSFITVKKTKRGRLVELNYFDVPAESYGDGYLTGVRLASEMMDRLKSGQQGFDMLRVIEAAVHGLDSPHLELSRRGAAVGLLRTIEKVLIASARHGIHEFFIAQEIARLKEFSRREEQESAIAKAAFVIRMKSAKAAKQRARQAAGGGDCLIAGAVLGNRETAHR